MVAIPLGWKLSIIGSEEIKTKLSDIDSQFQRGEISASQYAKELRHVNANAQAFNKIATVQKNVMLAQHPVLNSLSRGMSTLSSVSRGMMAISHLMNLVMISNNTTSSRRLEILKEVNETQRLVNKLIAEGQTGTLEYSLALEDAAIASAKLKEFNDTEFTQSFTNLFSTISGISQAISLGYLAISKDPKVMGAVIGAASRLGAWFGTIFVATSSSIIGVGTWLATALHISKLRGAIMLAGVRAGGVFGVSFTAAAIAIIGAGIADWIAEFFTGRSFLRDLGLPSTADIAKDVTGIETIPGRSGSNEAQVANAVRMKKMADDILNFFKPVTDLFTNLIPQAHAETAQSFENTFAVNIPQSIETAIPLIKAATLEMWNGIIDITNQAGTHLATASNQIFQALIAQINRVVRSHNNAARRVGKPTIPLAVFSPATFTPIPLIQAATGFEGIVSKPTMFMAGEAGAEAVSITPRSRGSGQTALIINNYFAGSLILERELFKKFDQYFKDQLKRRGFTGI